MKAGVIFTGTGPILILTTFPALDSPEFAQTLARKGIMKYLAHELDLSLVESKYGRQYQAISQDLKEKDDLRVLDYNGHNVFYNFSFKELGPPIYFE